MSNGYGHWAVGVLVALTVGLGLQWLVDTPTLALAGGIVWGTAAGLTVLLAGRFPAHATGSGWTDSRWTGLGVGVITFAGLLGVNTVAGLSTELRFALSALLLGAGYVGYVTGSMAELERTTA